MGQLGYVHAYTVNLSNLISERLYPGGSLDENQMVQWELNNIYNYMIIIFWYVINTKINYSDVYVIKYAEKQIPR